MSIQKIQFNGLEAVELKTADLHLVAVAAYGPRIAHCSRLGHENFLLWKPGQYTRGDWDLRGGHRVWMSRPGADEAEDTYRIDNAPCSVELSNQQFTITAPIDPVSQLQRGLTVRIINDNKLEVDNFLINRSDMLFSAGMWALTCTVPSSKCRYMIPVGDGSDWDSFSYILFRTWAGHGNKGFNDPQFHFSDDALIIDPQGFENKRMVQAHKGIIAMLDESRQQIFAKKVDFDVDARYPLNANIAAYVGPDNFMVEMETMGRESSLKPNKKLTMTETWVLKEAKNMPQKASDLEALF